ncbi:MAG: hypothetical protein JXA11_08270 [Phycisphaerae bacterium]|nr:hypothetical protein [Phycisphaerae bacterium]
MAAPMRNTSTPADESLLDSMAADHATNMSRRVRQIDSRSGSHHRRDENPALPPEAPEPDEPTPAVEGLFESEPSLSVADPILVDLPADISSVEIDASQPESAEEEPFIYEPTPESPANLAEEILSRQLAEESGEIGVSTESRPFESDLFEEELELPEEEAPAGEEIQEVINVLARPAPPKPVKPRVAIGAIRPSARPSRIRSLLIQGIIILLALTATAMVAYLMGILKL